MGFFSWVDHFYFTFGSFLVSIFTSCLCDCLDSFHCCLIYLLFPRSVRSFSLITVTVCASAPVWPLLCLATFEDLGFLFVPILDSLCFFLFFYVCIPFYLQTIPNLCICAIFNISLKVYSVYPKVYLTTCLIV